MQKRNLLIFPINISSAVEYSRIAGELDFNVIEASSDFDEEMTSKGKVYPLPYISDIAFNKAFEELLESKEIDIVYTPHPAVWNYLTNLSHNGEIRTPFQISNVAPLQAEWNSYESAYLFGSNCVEHNKSISVDAKILPVHLYANLYRNYHQIPGQCDDQKLMLLTQIIRQAPKGDIVEVGSLYGRSAFALAWLSEKYQTGSVVCIDPWKEENAADQGHEADVINSMVSVYDWDQIFKAFIVSLSAFNNVNYIREPSALAQQKYTHASRTGKISSEEFGITPITGKVSILHIDGNHKYENVKQDVELWLPAVKDGGWLLIDDYVWAFGDGPKRVGDELLETLQIKQSYLVGDTLCLQL